jgi:RNA polymerase sigma factor (sigma-70 family)
LQIDEIIAGCIRKDRRSQNALYKAFYPLLHNIASRYSASQNQISHLINTSFFKVLKSINNYDSQFALATWIRNIAINTSIDEYRKNASYERKIVVTEDLDEDENLVLNEGEQNLEESDVLELLHRLPAIKKNVLNLFVIDGYSHKEIAKLLKISEGVSRWHLNRARRMMKTLLEERQRNENFKRSLIK